MLPCGMQNSIVPPDMEVNVSLPAGLGFPKSFCLIGTKQAGWSGKQRAKILRYEWLMGIIHQQNVEKQTDCLDVRRSTGRVW